MDEKTLLDAFRTIVKQEIEPIRVEMKEGFQRSATRDELQAFATKDELNKALQVFATKEQMQDGFQNLEDLINEAAKDAARTEKLLREHIEQPIH